MRLLFTIKMHNTKMIEKWKTMGKRTKLTSPKVGKGKLTWSSFCIRHALRRAKISFRMTDVVFASLNANMPSNIVDMLT